jgi:lipid-binding SYLF domain-containing protein
MEEITRRRALGGLAAAAGAAALAPLPAAAATAAEIDAKVGLALARLLGESPTAQAVSEDAVAVLVFPDIVKAGFGFGGQYGEGALLRGGATLGYYNIASASFGFQIGAQSYAQAIYFMTEAALDYFVRSRGFEIGADANIAVLSEGAGIDVNTTSVQDPFVAFVFGQQGLMAGVTIEGSKISAIRR